LSLISSYPHTITNRKKETVICNSEDELLQHIQSGHQSLDLLILLLSAKINPQSFSRLDVNNLISKYFQYKNYGINYLYTGIDNTPSMVLEAFDFITGIINKIEYQKQKASMEKNNNRKIVK